MAVLNPTSALPGLARSMTNHLLTSRATYDVQRLTELFAPSGISESKDWTRGVDNTLQAAKAIGLLTYEAGGRVTVSSTVQDRADGRVLSRSTFRRVLREHVLDVQRDGDPWAADGTARTTGARDLTRALSWFLAQDALGPALSWVGPEDHNVQALQARQVHNLEDEERPFLNDTRWGAFSRWAVALGLVEPAPLPTGGTGLVPLPLAAMRDVISHMEQRVWRIGEFLDALAVALPVLDGGVVRTGLRQAIPEDPDPGVRSHSVDTSISQALLLLEEEDVVALTYGADAEARTFFDSQESRKVINVEVYGVKP